MRVPGKMSKLKFLIYFIAGSILGAVMLGVVGYLVSFPRGKETDLPVMIGAIFGAIFGGPTLASNLEKEK